MFLMILIVLHLNIVTGDYGANADNHPKFTITDTKLYVPVVTLSAQENEKLL